jgi:hypothetical protein
VRALTTAAANALAAGGMPIVLLIEMDLSSTLNLNTSNLDLVISGTTYYGTRGLGKIAPIGDTPAEVRGLSFEIQGVSSDRLSLALTEPVQGKAVRIKMSIFDPATYTVLDTRLRWAGWLDVMTISEQQGSAAISVTAEHAGIDLSRPGSSLYSDPEQQRLNTGDLFLQYMSDQVDQRIVWPAAEFFRK